MISLENMNMKNQFDMIRIQFPLHNDMTHNLPFYVLHIGSMEFQHPCIRENGLDDFQILFCSSGKGFLSVEGKEYIIQSGMGFFLRPDIPHTYFALEEPWTTHWILFHGNGIDLIPFLYQMGNASIFYVHQPEKYLFLHQKVYSAAEKTGLLNQNELSTQLYAFLLELEGCICDSPQKNNAQEERLHQVITYLEQHYAQDITLVELADIAHISPQHLCREFKQYYHMRPMEYLIQYRLNQAKHLLITNPQLTLKEIIHTIGFHDISYFCSAFKKAFGMTPAEFKKSH